MAYKNEHLRKNIDKLRRECQRIKKRNNEELRKIKRKLKNLINESFRNKRHLSLMKHLENLSTVEKLLGNEKKSNYIKEKRASIGYLIYLERKRMIKRTYARCSEISTRFQTFLLQPVNC